MPLSNFQPRPQVYPQKLLPEYSNRELSENRIPDPVRPQTDSSSSVVPEVSLDEEQAPLSDREVVNGTLPTGTEWGVGERSTAELARRAQEGVRRGVITPDTRTSSSDEVMIPPRILVVGAAGWGKSTLINNMFGDIVTPVSAGGTPVTPDFQEFGPKPNTPVRLVDSRGLERHTHSEQLRAILRFVRARARMPVADRVHALWLVVGERWQQADAQLLQSLRVILPVVVVISKCDLPERSEIDPRSGLPAKIALRDEIVKQFDDVDVVFCADPRKRSRDWEPPTCGKGHARDYFMVNNRTRTWRCEFRVDGRGRVCGESGHAEDRLIGYVNLSKITLWKLPMEVMPAFVHAQRANRALKDSRAVAIIHAGVLAMTGIAATPIPFPDLPLLMAAEVYMATRLFLLYNVPAEFASVALFSAVNAAVIGSMGIVAKILAKVLKASGAGLPVGVAVDVIVSAVAGTTMGIAIAKVSSKWMVLTAEENQGDVESFRIMLLDAVKGIEAPALVKAIVRLIVFKDDRALTNLIHSDVNVNVNSTESTRYRGSHQVD